MYHQTTLFHMLPILAYLMCGQSKFSLCVTKSCLCSVLPDVSVFWVTQPCLYPVLPNLLCVMSQQAL